MLFFEQKDTKLKTIMVNKFLYPSYAESPFKDKFNNEKHYEAYLRMLTNFHEEVIKAGGTFQYEDLSSLSVVDMMIRLAPNNIRFSYKKA